MSNDSDTSKSRRSFTRRRFAQSTALLTGISVGGKHLIEPSPVHAQESAADVRLAQVAPMQGARAPAALVQELPELPETPDISVQEFVRLSQILTGIDELEPDLAAEYLWRCWKNPKVSGQLKRLVQALSSLQGSRTAIEKGLGDKLHADEPLFVAAEQIIYVWYIGAFFYLTDPPKGVGYWEYGPPEHYFRGKIWPVIGVKPPMTAHRSNNFWSAKPGT